MGPWKIDDESFPRDGTESEKIRFLLGYAILAPSTFNTQPWKFMIREQELMVFADMNRWLKISDADLRELYISVGCALENFLIAARHFGFASTVSYFPQGDGSDLVAILRLSSSGLHPGEEDELLFKMIPLRQTRRGTYEGRRIGEQDLKRLLSIPLEEGIILHLTDSSEIMSKVGDLIFRADVVQYADWDYRRELGQWIGKRVFGEPWLAAQIEKIKTIYLNRGRKYAEADRAEFLSASHLGIICSKENTRLMQVKVGQVFERLSLIATSLEIGVQPVSQVMEVPEIKEEFKDLLAAQFLKKDEVPQHPFRLGYARPEEHTPRRPLEEVLTG